MAQKALTASSTEVAGEGAGSSPGDRVAVYNKLYCGYCEQCLTGRHNLCDNEPGQLGFNMDGGDAEYLAVPARNLVPVPGEVDLASAAVLTCVGSLTTVALRYANRGEPAVRTGHFEIVSLVGTLGRDGGHLHLCAADGDGVAFARRLITEIGVSCVPAALNGVTMTSQPSGALGTPNALTLPSCWMATSK